MKLPDINNILADQPEQHGGTSKEALQHKANLLEAQLKNFGIVANVVEMHVGAVITRYELKITAGTKVKQISALSDDLAMALMAKSVNILAPIPGKSTIGIDIPNENPKIIHIKTLLQSDCFKPNSNEINLVLGEAINGTNRVMDLTRAPHLLIAGRTGSGKSVCVNSFMASMLCSKSPEELKMILIDPKMVELFPYNDLPHLLTPVVTDPKVAVDTLKRLVSEMENRYKLLSGAKSRNIQNYNFKIRENVVEGDLMPFIVVVIDEFADLMITSKKEIEQHIVRIAQKARAIGIHLILTTQRPSIDVITGIIKANLPSRIGFHTSSQVDSKTIMDIGGCEKLLGNGDMFFCAVDSPVPERIHGTFISEEEVENITGAWKAQSIESEPMEEEKEEEIEDPNGKDIKLNDAVELVLENKRPSASFLQRRMGIDLNRAKNLIETMEQMGILEDL